MTGVSYFNEAIVAKRVQLLKEFVPGLTRIAVLRNPTIAVHATFWRETEVPAQTLGLVLQEAVFADQTAADLSVPAHFSIRTNLQAGADVVYSGSEPFPSSSRI
ncbi:hypothetical protein [Bradyrhizobium sp. NBAIM01]|uniref:hypothetical protein n=1 Tax=Bradyrhizobium sp. NBAIM01 TaxID=2793818 RepID=UPI001CD61B7C|nr:hypothetical protein [Bradyrhizobium sp. NBAIM01]